MPAVNAVLLGGPADGETVTLPVGQDGTPPDMHEAFLMKGRPLSDHNVPEVANARGHYYRRGAKPIGDAPWEYRYQPPK